MTIHDILVNCRSVQSDSLITILSTRGWKVKRECFVKSLEQKYETLPLSILQFVILWGDNKPKLHIRFYV